MLDNKDFENKAWGNMLELLEQELPEKKAFPWLRLTIALLFFIMIGGGVGYYYTHDTTSHSIDKNSLSIAPQFANNHISEEKTTALSNHSHIINETTKTAHYNTINSDERALASNNHSPSNDLHEQVRYSYSNNTSTLIANEPNMEPNLSTSSNNTAKEDDKNTMKPESASMPILETVENVLNATEEFTFLLSLHKPAPLTWNTEMASLREISEKDMLILNPIPRARRVDYYAYSEINYISDFRNVGFKLGGLVELGAEKSPWSVSSGLLYEVNYLGGIRFGSNDLLETLPDSSTSNPTGIADKIEDASSLLSVSYLNIPLQFHYRFNRIKIGLGIQNKFLLNQRLRNGQNALSNLFVTNQSAEERDQSSINNYHLSANQSLIYRIHPNYDLGVAFQYDLTGIFAASSFTSNNIYTANRLDNIGLSLAYRFQ